MNFLITALGSMSAETVIESIREHFSDAKIVGTDLYPADWSWVSKKVDFFYILPKATDDNYIDQLLEISIKEKIDFIIPLTDPEVDVLAENISLFEKNRISLGITNPKVVKLVRDKYQLAKFFKNHRTVKIIPTFYFNEIDNTSIIFPWIAKKINGRSSEGLKLIENFDQLNGMKEVSADYIFQPRLMGKIYTVDIVRDRYGNIVAIPRKEKIRTSNGAGLSIDIILDTKLISLSELIASELDFIGAMNFEFIEFNGEYFLMDINPRFSAGVSFSRLAGYDFVLNSIRAFNDSAIEQGKEIMAIRAIKIFQDKLL